MSGALLAMPMLVINMGGEMVYILEQRLRAQKIPVDKSRKVLSDVVKTMYSRKFIRELFRPQQLYSSHSTRQIFDRLAHSSIMRLNTNSMDKLYDLMTMGFKFQMLSCTSPSHLLQVTLNHLDTLIDIVATPSVATLIEEAADSVRSTYGELSIGEFFALKHTLCRFFQDRRVKVSLFLQDGSQNMDGTIVLTPTGPLPIGTTAPGVVQYRDGRTGDLTQLRIDGTAAPDLGSPFKPATRPCRFGKNMYAKERAKDVPNKPPVRMRRGEGATAVAYVPTDEDARAAAAAAEGSSGKHEEDPEESKETRGTATAGLNLLANLIGADDGAAPSTFKISNLFPENVFTSDSKSDEAAVITIDATDRRTMQDMMRKLDLGDDSAAGGGKEAEDEEDDLLALMDSAT